MNVLPLPDPAGDEIGQLVSLYSTMPTGCSHQREARTARNANVSGTSAWKPAPPSSSARIRAPCRSRTSARTSERLLGYTVGGGPARAGFLDVAHSSRRPGRTCWNWTPGVRGTGRPGRDSSTASSARMAPTTGSIASSASSTTTRASPSEFLGHRLDINDRKQTEEALRERASQPGRRQQGTGGVQLLRLARPARSAAQHRRLQPGAAGGLCGPARRAGPQLSAARARRHAAHGRARSTTC